MRTAKSVAGPPGFYYGWIIVAISAVSMAFWFGVRSSFSVFYVALLEDFTWDRGESAGVQSLAMISYTLVAPVVGGLIDRFGPRRVIVPGIVLLVVGLLLCATIENLMHFYLFYGLIVGCGVTCIGIVSYSVILAHWFEKRRGLANGIAGSGLGLGIFCLVPLVQYLISTWGWHLTFAVFGAAILIVLFPLNAVFLRHKPGDMGLYVDGREGPAARDETTPEAIDGQPPHRDWTFAAVLRSGRFWAMMAFPFFSLLGIYIIFVHHVQFLVDQGIDKMTAAFVLAGIGAISSVFRIFWGWLSDHIGREITFTAGIVFLCMGVSALLLFETTGAGSYVYIFFICFGVGWGVTAPMFMSTAADIFKGKVFGLIYGMVEGGIGLAGAIGSWAAGLIYDNTGSYQSAFSAAIAVMILSCVFIWLAAPRKFRSRQAG